MTFAPKSCPQHQSDLGPQPFLTTGETVEVLLLGDCRFPLASGLLLGAPHGVDASALGREGRGCVALLADRSRSSRRGTAARRAMLEEDWSSLMTSYGIPPQESTHPRE